MTLARLALSAPVAFALEPLCPVDSSLPSETRPDTLPSLDLAATLPARALRHLLQHSAIHLDVCWRDLPGPACGASVDHAVRDFPRPSATNIWRQTLALGSSAAERDVPKNFRHVLAQPAYQQSRACAAFLIDIIDLVVKDYPLDLFDDPLPILKAQPDPVWTGRLVGSRNAIKLMSALLPIIEGRFDRNPNVHGSPPLK